jgi:hypothetical protein
LIYRAPYPESSTENTLLHIARWKKCSFDVAPLKTDHQMKAKANTEYSLLWMQFAVLFWQLLGCPTCWEAFAPDQINLKTVTYTTYEVIPPGAIVLGLRFVLVIWKSGFLQRSSLWTLPRDVAVGFATLDSVISSSPASPLDGKASDASQERLQYAGIYLPLILGHR